MNLRPTSLNKCTGYLPFFGSNCELKGVTILRNWVALCNSSLWDAGSGHPFQLFVCKGTLPEWRPFLVCRQAIHMNKNKTIKKFVMLLGILLVIKFAHLDAVLVGENFTMTAYCIFIGLGLLFISINKKDEEIQQLRDKMHHPESKKTK
jgi:hypothetical protein